MSWLSFGIFCLTIFILRLPALNCICHCTGIFLSCCNPVHSWWLRCCSVGRERGTCCAPQPSVRCRELWMWGFQLSKGPCVCLSSIHVGIPHTLVPECCPATLTFIFVCCPHGLPHSLVREHCCSRSQPVHRQVQQEREQRGQSQQGTGSSCTTGLCPGSPAQMLTCKHVQKLSLKSCGFAYV